MTNPRTNSGAIPKIICNAASMAGALLNHNVETPEKIFTLHSNDSR
jgi:hypothetical protein